jgi:hypothetical protein
VKHSELSVSERMRLDQRNKKRTNVSLAEDQKSVVIPPAQKSVKKRKLTTAQGVKEEGTDVRRS